MYADWRRSFWRHRLSFWASCPLGRQFESLFAQNSPARLFFRYPHLLITDRSPVFLTIFTVYRLQKASTKIPATQALILLLAQGSSFHQWSSSESYRFRRLCVKQYQENVNSVAFYWWSIEPNMINKQWSRALTPTTTHLWLGISVSITTSILQRWPMLRTCWDTEA